MVVMHTQIPAVLEEARVEATSGIHHNSRARAQAPRQAAHAASVKEMTGTEIQVSLAWVPLASTVCKEIQVAVEVAVGTEAVVAVMELTIGVQVVAVVQAGRSPSRATETGKKKTLLMRPSLF
mgnify:CR=1 FL=1